MSPAVNDWNHRDAYLKKRISPALRSSEATRSDERVVRYEWPGKFTEVYSPVHNDFRPSYFEEPELWSGFEIEFATSGFEALDRVVIRIRRKSDQVRRPLAVVHAVIVRDRDEMPIDGPFTRLVA